MPGAGSWNVISGENSNRVILVVDFPAAGRTEAGFIELAARMGPEYKFLQTAPPSVRPDQRPGSDAYIQPWIQAAQRGGWQVTAVLGYCVGSIYAAPIAEGVSEWQRIAPKVILLDPLSGDIRLLAAEMYKMIDRLSPLLSSEEIGQAGKRTAELTESEPGDVAEAAIGLVGIYREIGSAAFGRLGLDESRGNEMIQLFESYMSWISVAAQIDPRRTWKRSVAIMSADYVKQAAEDPSAGVLNSIVDRTIPLDVTHGDLLRSDATVEAVRGQLEAS